MIYSVKSSTADKRIELKAAIHYHLDRGATEHEQPAQAT